MQLVLRGSRKSKRSAGRASCPASVTPAANTSQGTIASIAANGSCPACLAASNAWPILTNNRTLSPSAGQCELLGLDALGAVEQRDEEPVVQTDDFIGHGGAG
ncbi:MAG TPA: hypothetical protein VIO57_11750 [Chloroflexota bacterium]